MINLEPVTAFRTSNHIVFTSEVLYKPFYYSCRDSNITKRRPTGRWEFYNIQMSSFNKVVDGTSAYPQSLCSFWNGQKFPITRHNILLLRLLGTLHTSNTVVSGILHTSNTLCLYYYTLATHCQVRLTYKMSLIKNKYSPNIPPTCETERNYKTGIFVPTETKNYTKLTVPVVSSLYSLWQDVCIGDPFF